MSDANKATSLAGAVRSSVASASASVLAMATAGELGGVDVRRRERSSRPVRQLGDCFPYFPFVLFLFSASEFQPPCRPVKARKMLEAGLSHDVSWGGFGWYFLPSWDCWGLWQLQIRPRQGVSSGGGNNDDEAQGVRLERVSACKGKSRRGKPTPEFGPLQKKKKERRRKTGQKRLAAFD